MMCGFANVRMCGWGCTPNANEALKRVPLCLILLNQVNV